MAMFEDCKFYPGGAGVRVADLQPVQITFKQGEIEPPKPRRRWWLSPVIGWLLILVSWAINGADMVAWLHIVAALFCGAAVVYRIWGDDIVAARRSDGLRGMG